MGTALTKDQARILKRYTDKVFISYDGDFAGQKASIRGLEILSEEGLEVKVVSLPDGLDPDDVIKKMGAEGYQNLLEQAKPLIDFKLDILRRTYDINTVDGKRKYITNAVRVIKESPSPAEQEDLLKTVRDLTGTTFESLKRELYSAPEKPKIEREEDVQFNDNAGDKIAIAERFVLASYLFNKPHANETDISEFIFTIPVHVEIQKYIIDKMAAKEKINFSNLYELLGDAYPDDISRIAAMEAGDKKGFDQAEYFFDCVKTIKTATLNKKIERLTTLFSAETDTDKRRQFAAEMTKLIAEKNKLI